MDYTIKSGQDIFDVVIQNFGDIETGLFPTLTANSLGLNKITLAREYVTNRTLTLNNEETPDNKVRNYFKQRNFNLNNADEEYYSLSLGDFGTDFNFDFN